MMEIRLKSFAKLLVSISIATQAHSAFAECAWEFQLGHERITLGETTRNDITNAFTYAEKFAYGEFGSQAICYSNSANEFLVFGFNSEKPDATLTSIAIDATPPTGHPGNFCRTIESNLFVINEYHLGKKIASTLSNHPVIDSSTIFSKLSQNCTLATNKVFFAGRLIAIGFYLSDKLEFD